MRLLLIVDSHCCELVDIFTELSDYSVYTVFVPNDIASITLQYRSEIQAINQFRPEVTLIHMGHNDLVYHPSHNLSPSNSSTVASETITFANETHINHPHSIIYVSAILPRSYTRRSLLSEAQVTAYNKIAKRHGQRARTYSKIAGYKCMINNSMWKNISASIEHSDYYLKDGLHLNRVGQLALVSEWIQILTPRPALPETTTT